MGYVQDAVNAHIAANRWTREGEAPAWYPSNLGKCDRQAILKRAGVPGIPLDERTLRVFWMGDEVHEALTKAVESGLPEHISVVGHQIPVRALDYEIRGRLDTLVYDHETDELEVIDYKSIRSDGFKPDLPKPQDVLQVGIYATFLAVMAEEDSGVALRYPTRGRIVYWSKDDARMQECTFPITAELRQEVRQKLVSLTDGLLIYKESGELPTPIPMLPQLDENGQQEFYKRGPRKGQPKQKEDWIMRYCPYKGSGMCCADIHGVN